MLPTLVMMEIWLAISAAVARCVPASSGGPDTAGITKNATLALSKTVAYKQNVNTVSKMKINLT